MMFDYAELLLKAKAHLKQIEAAMTKRNYKDAVTAAHDLAVEARLLTHIAREKNAGEKTI
jgi:hypothetical protein